jgi:hypothetical protein
MPRSLDYIDLFLIHDPLSGPERRLETYKALHECRIAGKIRTVGVSNLCGLANVLHVHLHNPLFCSGIKHLEEIKSAGYGMPSVNQIEVHVAFLFACYYTSDTFRGTVASALSTEVNRLVLRSELDCRPSLLPVDPRTDGSPCHLRSS